MRRSTKIWLIIASIFLIFGILLTVSAVIALNATGGHIRTRTVLYPAQTSMAQMDSIETLSLSLVNEPVYIVRGGDAVTIEWSSQYDGQYRLVQIEGRTLALSREPFFIGPFGLNWFNPLNLNFNLFGTRFQLDPGIEDASNRPVTVTIPEGMNLRKIDLSGVDIRVDMADVDARAIEISGANTNVRLHNIYAQDIEIVGANAVVNLKNVIATDIDVNGANAEAIITLPSLDGWGFEVNGLHAELLIDAQRRTRVTGGENTITVNGLNAILDVRTKGQ